MRHVSRKQDLTASRALLALIDASYYDDVDDDYHFMMIMFLTMNIMMMMIMFVVIMIVDIQFLIHE